MADKVQPITYIWTPQDDVIRGGSSEGSAQGNYVSPYGIPYSEVPSETRAQCQTFKPVELDLHWCKEGARVDRFKVPGPWQKTDITAPPELWGADWMTDPKIKHDVDPWADQHAYEWVELDPSPVKDLAGLCAYLAKLDPVQYPPGFYSVTTGPWTVNAAKILFDYWGNTVYRANAIKAGHYPKYINSAGEIPVSVDACIDGYQGPQKLKWVLRKKQHLPPANVAPSGTPYYQGKPLFKDMPDLHLNRQSLDDLDGPLVDYLKLIEESVEQVKFLLVTNERVTKERAALLGQLVAVRAIARASQTSSLEEQPDQPNPTATAVLALLDESSQDKLLPRARDILMSMPVGSRTITQERHRDPEGKGERYTSNAGAGLKAERDKLINLLFSNQEYTTLVSDWTKAATPELASLKPDSIVGVAPVPGGLPLPPPPEFPAVKAWQLHERLHAAFTNGLKALGETGGGPITFADWEHGGKPAEKPVAKGLSEVLSDLYDRCHDSHAKTEDDIKGNVPIEVALNFVGKYVSFGAKVSKLGSAMVRVHASLEIARLANGALKATTGKPWLGMEKVMKAFADGLLQRLPEKLPSGETDIAGMKLREKAVKALVEGKEGELKELAASIAKKQKNGFSQFADIAGTLNVAFVAVAFANVKASDVDGSTPISIVNFFDLTGNGASAVVGTSKTMIEALGGSAELVARLGNLGSALGLLTAVTGCITGTVTYCQLCDKGDWTGAAMQGLAVVGGVATGLVAAAAYFGAAMGPVGIAVEAFGIACVIVSGAYSLDKLSMELSKPATNKVAYAIVHRLREKYQPDGYKSKDSTEEIPDDVALWQKIERGNIDIQNWMQELEDLCQNGNMRLAPERVVTRNKLLAAGLDREAANEICSREGPGLNHPEGW